MMTTEEFKADVYRFAKDLSEKTGVDLDPEKVYQDCLTHMVPESREQMSTIYTDKAVAKIIAAHRLFKQFTYDGTPPRLCLCGARFTSDHLHDLHVAERINNG